MHQNGQRAVCVRISNSSFTAVTNAQPHKLVLSRRTTCSTHLELAFLLSREVRAMSMSNEIQSSLAISHLWANAGTLYDCVLTASSISVSAE